jgi:hypothetical protein
MIEELVDEGHELPGRITDTPDTVADLPGVMETLGKLEPGAIVNEEGIAKMFDRHPTSVKRAVHRGELPPPTRLFGSNTWTAGVLIQHIEARLAEALKEHDDTILRLERLSP